MYSFQKPVKKCKLAFLLLIYHQFWYYQQVAVNTSNRNCELTRSGSRILLSNMCDVPSACPAGMFGPGCRHRCQCENGALCDHVSGACTCQVGWTGTVCEKCERSSLTPEINELQNFCMRWHPELFTSMCVSACPQGFFGLDCQEKCLCLNGGSCDHVTGVCSCPAGWIGAACDQSEWQVHLWESKYFQVVKKMWNQSSGSLYQGISGMKSTSLLFGPLV